MTAVLPEVPDLLVTGAEILTQWDPLPRAQAMGIRQGRVCAVGRPDDVRRVLRPNAREWHLDGRTIVPGFVDGHCHLEMTCEALDHQVFVQAPPVRSIAELLGIVERARADRPRGWLICRSSFMLQDKVPEGRLPTMRELDRISADEPLVVLAGLHVACVNSAALRGLRLPARPPRGLTVHRDAAGQPTGVLTEVWDRLPTLPVDDVVTSLRHHVGPQFVANGVTTACTIPTSADDVRALHRLARDGELPLRVQYYVHVPRTASLEQVLGWGPSSGFGDDRLTFGGIKIFIDGEGGDGLGNPVDDTKWTREELFNFVRTADAADIQLFMHAVTPGAIRLAAEAVVNARQTRQRAGSPRHRIEHAGDYVDTVDLPLLRRAGVGVVATPHFSRSAGVADGEFQPLRAIVDAGLRPIGASDSTGTVPDAVSPLSNIAAAVNRVDASGRPSPHRITAQEGLAMFTSWAAYGCHRETEVGALLPGGRADFAVLSENPLAVPSEQLNQIRVLATVVDGSVHHDVIGMEQS